MDPKHITKIIAAPAAAILILGTSAHAELPLNTTVAIDFGTTDPDPALNFNKFDGFANNIEPGATLAFVDQIGEPSLIDTDGNLIADVAFTVRNESGASTGRTPVVNGGQGPAPFADESVYGDCLISNNVANMSNPSFGELEAGGFLVLTFSGLNDAYAYNLSGGYLGGGNRPQNFDTTWEVDGQSLLASSAEGGYLTFTNLRTDGAGNLEVTLIRSNHVNVGALALTAVPSAAAADFQIIDVTYDDDELAPFNTVRWEATSGRFYGVDYSTDLAAGSWLEVTDGHEATSDIGEFVHPLLPLYPELVGAPRLFYRVRLIPLPAADE